MELGQKPKLLDVLRIAVRVPTASDRSSKGNIVCVGAHPLGSGFDLFDCKPKFCDGWGHGRRFVLVADELKTDMAKAVCMHPDGHQMVDYEMLGISRSGL